MAQKINTESSPAELEQFTTAEAAARLKLVPATMRHAYHLHGHYGGIRPVKMTASRRLLWPADEIRRLAAGEATK